MPKYEFDGVFAVLCFFCPPVIFYYGLARAIDHVRGVPNPPWFCKTVDTPDPPIYPAPGTYTPVIPTEPTGVYQNPRPYGSTWTEILSAPHPFTEFWKHKVCREGRKGNLLSEIVKGIRVGWQARSRT